MTWHWRTRPHTYGRMHWLFWLALYEWDHRLAARSNNPWR